MFLQKSFIIDKLYTVGRTRRILELTFPTVVLHSDEGLQSETSVPKFFSLRCKTYLFMGPHEKRVHGYDANILLYRRYVDDTFCLFNIETGAE